MDRRQTLGTNVSVSLKMMHSFAAAHETFEEEIAFLRLLRKFLLYAELDLAQQIPKDIEEEVMETVMDIERDADTILHNIYKDKNGETPHDEN